MNILNRTVITALIVTSFSLTSGAMNSRDVNDFIHQQVKKEDQTREQVKTVNPVEGLIRPSLSAQNQSFIDQIKNKRPGVIVGAETQGEKVKPDAYYFVSFSIEGVTSNPPETRYYTGVTGSGSDMHERGGEALVTSESGKAVTDSMVNNPTESISMDAPFLQTGITAKENAEAIVSGTGDFCEKSIMSNISYERFTCNRDVNVEEVCTRTSKITGSWRDTSALRYITIPASSFSYSASGSTVNFGFNSPAKGTIKSATMAISPGGFWFSKTTNILNTTFNGTWYQPVTVNLTSAPGIYLSQGQWVAGSITFQNSSLARGAANSLQSRKATISITMYMAVEEREWIPRVEWSEFCPFDKKIGVLVKSQCTEVGSTKTVYVEGKAYKVTQSCWAYKDSYLTQSGSEGSCGEFMKNPACTVVKRQCDSYADADDGGYCVGEAVTYECEKVTQAEGMLCGGDFYCTDGKCEETKQGQDNGFKHAVSQLAAVAAAGDDVAELNNTDIKAFTGDAQVCRKAAVGFSDCCKDSGWGNDLGIDNCNSEEKALGEAKERKLTVEIGQYCSRKVLGVCLQKKKAYCVFDSKLAQIVQQQGRKWQLGIGFGKAKSPDCRGITIDELQRINFDLLDFRNFYSDLDEGLKVPEDSEIMKRVNEQIKEELSKKGTK